MTTKKLTDAPLCAYCGDEPAARRPATSKRPGGTKYYRKRPTCLGCRNDFEAGRRPKPQCPRESAGGRNGRSDLQRWPDETDPGWDDVVRALEDAPCD